MTPEQTAICVIMAATVGLFLWGKWRHDMVAMGALLACVFVGLVPSGDAFMGFAHPAVITVACVLVLSRALQTSGAVDIATRHLLPTSSGPTVTIAALTSFGALLSAFMNNVGALALLMPVCIQVAGRLKISAGKVLMPVAFGSILGGMTTLIGTPPNLIVSGFRAEAGGGSFSMFDFAPVGIVVAGAGVLFIILGGWRLVPAREREGKDSFETGPYLTEARLPEDSRSVGKTLRDLGATLAEADAQVVALVRSDVRIPTPHPGRKLLAGDILVIEAEPDGLTNLLGALGLKLDADVPVSKNVEKPEKAAQDSLSKKSKTPAPKDKPEKQSASGASDIVLMEVTVRPSTDMVGRSTTDIQLRSRFGINLLALSRQGRRSIRRLRSEKFRAGDVLLLQGYAPAILNFANATGCVPLAERALRIPNKKQALVATGIMATAVSGAAFGLLPAAICFAAGVLACMVLRVVPFRSVYESVDWPVVVLLAGLIPVAGAMATTGTADLIAGILLDLVAQGHAVMALTLILVVTMTLSDFMNNAATAAVMCPIAIGTARQLDAGPDSFLMAVAIGASCAFLTPIGHQNNTLILGPGGFRFGDYWRLGLPLEVIVIAVSIPMLLIIWPL